MCVGLCAYGCPCYAHLMWMLGLNLGPLQEGHALFFFFFDIVIKFIAQFSTYEKDKQITDNRGRGLDLLRIGIFFFLLL